MDGFVLILELIGTVAFAASGAIIAIRKQMDVFGVCVLALTTAVGGGIIRDLLLGVIPPYSFQNPIYAFTATLVAVIVREGRVIVPFGNDHIEDGDRVVIIACESGISDLNEVIRK